MVLYQGKCGFFSWSSSDNAVFFILMCFNKVLFVYDFFLYAKIIILDYYFYIYSNGFWLFAPITSD